MIAKHEFSYDFSSLIREPAAISFEKALEDTKKEVREILSKPLGGSKKKLRETKH